MLKDIWQKTSSPSLDKLNSIFPPYTLFNGLRMPTDHPKHLFATCTTFVDKCCKPIKIMLL